MKKTMLLAALAMMGLWGCKQELSTGTLATLYYNGTIITMEGDSPEIVEALVERDGKILFVGSLAEAKLAAGTNGSMVDLQGHTMLPGFVDPHSHLMDVANALNQANLNGLKPTPENGFGVLVAPMQQFAATNHLKDGDWIVGSGYDPNLFTAANEPTRARLDSVFPNNPVLMIDISGHAAVADSAALSAVGYTTSISDAGGSVDMVSGIVRDKKLDPFMPFAFPPFPKDASSLAKRWKDEFSRLDSAQNYYASNGITTAAEHLGTPPKQQVLDSAANGNKLYLDVEYMPSYNFWNLPSDSLYNLPYRKPNNRLNYRAVKLTVDSAPISKTALMSRNYDDTTGISAHPKGTATIRQGALDTVVEECYRRGIQVFAHCNGDSAIGMMISAHEKAVSSVPDHKKDLRTVVVHSQFIRKDQLEIFKKDELFPSFFTNHTYYWGDLHIKNFGEERAAFLSPMNSALKLGIKCTNHSDCNVTPVSPLFTVWTAVNRTSSTGTLIGGDERISVYQALQACTISSAYQYFSEAEKGSLKVGKLADFVILDQNPLAAETVDIREIKVLQTIKEGKTIFPRRD
jgi:predicted amidohydrolase YtcJ